jgi:hypothetical protein
MYNFQKLSEATSLRCNNSSENSVPQGTDRYFFTSLRKAIRFKCKPAFSVRQLLAFHVNSMLINLIWKISNIVEGLLEIKGDWRIIYERKCRIKTLTPLIKNRYAVACMASTGTKTRNVNDVRFIFTFPTFEWED